MEKQSPYLIIIPAYNEAETIEEVVTRAQKHADVCIIDDNSSDATPDILKRIDGIHVIHHAQNTHIPGGLLDGMRYAVSQGYSHGIAMDAGLSHDPDEIPRFIDHPDADLVIGVRQTKHNTPLFRRLLSTTGNFIYNISLDFPASVFKTTYYRDLTSGYRRYSSRAMKMLTERQMESRSFDILLETVAYIYRSRFTIGEVPIRYTFSNSSLSPRVVKDCMKMSARLILRQK